MQALAHQLLVMRGKILELEPHPDAASVASTAARDHSSDLGKDGQLVVAHARRPEGQHDLRSAM